MPRWHCVEWGTVEVHQTPEQLYYTTQLTHILTVLCQLPFLNTPMQRYSVAVHVDQTFFMQWCNYDNIVNMSMLSVCLSFALSPVCLSSVSVCNFCVPYSACWNLSQGGHWLVQMEWRSAGWSVCLPLLIFPCTIKSGTSLLAPAHPGGPGKMAAKRLWWLWFSTPFGTLAIRWHPQKILRRLSQGNPSIGQSNTRGLAKYSDFGSIERYILETMQDRKSVSINR